MTSKNVKIPVELVELIEKRSGGRPPGEVLFEIVNDYVKFENYVLSLKFNLTGKETMSELVIRVNELQKANMADVQKQITDLKTMLQGMEMWFTRFGNRG